MLMFLFDLNGDMMFCLFVYLFIDSLMAVVYITLGSDHSILLYEGL